MKISRGLPLWKGFELLVMGPADVLHAEQIKLQMVIYLQNFGSKMTTSHTTDVHYIKYIYMYIYIDNICKRDSSGDKWKFFR